MANVVTEASLSRPVRPVPARPLPAGPAGETVAVTEMWRILWHRRRTVAATAAVLAALTAGYGLLTPRLYTATAEILIDPRDRQVVTNDVNPSTVSPDGGVTQIESQVSVIQSNNVLMRAIAATDLTHDPEFNRPGLLDRLGPALGLGGAGGSDASAAPAAAARTLAALRRTLAVKRADRVLVIDVTITARTADKAARIANAIVDGYLDDQAEARSTSAEEASKALTASLAAQRQRVENAEGAVQRYRVAHNIVVATGQVVSEQQLTDVNNQLATAQSRVSMLKAQIDQIRRQRQGGSVADATAEALQSPVIAKLRETETALAQRAAAQSMEYGPRHPAVAALTMQRRDARRLIESELDRIAQAATADYDRAFANEKALSAKLDSLKQQTLNNDQANVGLRELQRDLDSVRTVYAAYLNRAQETREQITIDSTNARVITHALPPQQSSWPPTPLLLAGGLAGGVGLGAGLALLQEYAVPTVLSRGQVEGLAEAPVVGILAGRPARRRRRGGAGRAGAGAAETDQASRKTDAVMGLALRRLSGRTGSTLARGHMRSLFLCSGASDADPRERVVQHLAEAAAFRGDRVLVIRADESGATGEREAGLLDVLTGECAFDRTVRFEPLEPAAAGLPIAVIGPGRPRPRFVESKAGPLAARMMADAARDFDLVIVDAGAVTENPRAAVLLAGVDEVVLVAALHRTAQADVVDTVDALATMGRPVSAVVLVDPMAAV